MQMRGRPLKIALVTLVLALLLAGGVAATVLSETSAQAQTSVTSGDARSTTTTAAPTTDKDGVQHFHFEYGPLDIAPGQNLIQTNTFQIPQPEEDGWVVGFKPGLQFPNGKVPPVDVLHLHHGVWAVANRRDATFPLFPERFIAAGEEKTTLELPDGFGYRYSTADRWYLNYMIHDLTAKPFKASLTYDVDFVPASSPKASVDEGRAPDLARRAERQGLPGVRRAQGQRHEREVHLPRRRSQRAARQHVHGAHRRRAGEDVRPPAPRWSPRHLLRHARRPDEDDLHVEGEVLRARGGGVVGRVDDGHARRLAGRGEGGRHAEPHDHLRHDPRLVVRVDGPRGGVDVRRSRAARTRSRSRSTRRACSPTGTCRRTTTTAGRRPRPSSTPARPASGPLETTIPIGSFEYGAGDLAAKGKIPTVTEGQSITFDNFDAADQNVWHSITACKAPCTASTGVAYPLADADVQFDSGQLGDAGQPTSGSTTWSTPSDLAAGTYTYFCRVHPFMRGAFRVVAPPGSESCRRRHPSSSRSPADRRAPRPGSPPRSRVRPRGSRRGRSPT